MRNVTENREIIGDGITAVYAVLTDKTPKFLFGHPDSSYTYAFPDDKKAHFKHEQENKSEDLEVIQTAVYVGKSWMELR